MSYHLSQTLSTLAGPTKEQIISLNQWAAVALDKFHAESKAIFEFSIDDYASTHLVEWDSSFSKVAMKEDVDIANNGGVAIAFFVMAVLLNYRYTEQTEIGEGVDYLFKENEPGDDDLNFLDAPHYVEISG